DWNLPNQYIHLPGGLTAHVATTEVSTALDVNSYLTDLKFESPAGLKYVVDSFTKASAVVMSQVEKRNLQMDSLSRELPPFTLTMNASGRGLLNQFLVPSGMSIDTVYGELRKDSIFTGDFGVRKFITGSMTIDTLGLALSERRNLLDYKLHMGNRPGTLDEFAQVNVSGYLGANRVGAYLTQHNIKGKMGYRLGFTGALQDSVVSLHLTPLKSTIAYLPWELNADNYIDYNLYNRKIDANLEAKSSESSILLRTEPTKFGEDGLRAKLDNIHIQDFLSMFPTAPKITGSIDSDLTIVYNGSSLFGGGSLDVNKLTYEKYTLGDFNLGLKAGMGNDGRSGVDATLKINDKDAVTAYARLRNDSVGGLEPDSLGVNLTQFPLNIANPFLNNMATLGGALTGSMRMDGSFTKPVLNGLIAFDNASVYIPMAGCTLTMDPDSIRVVNSVIDFDQFGIHGANENPIYIDGQVNASDFANILLDLTADAKNCQLVKSNSSSRGDLYGKLFFDLGASVKGSLSLMDIKANLNILGNTDATYRLNLNPDQLAGSSTSNVVKFVNFNDTTQVVKADSVAQASSMRIRAGLTISPGAQFTVLLMGSGKVQVQPTATLNYFQNYMGDMRLNGNVTLGDGYVRYSIPVIGEKMFDFNPASQVVWSGDLMNPRLNIMAYDEMKASVTQGSVSRLVNFIVSLNVGGTLSSPKVSFDLSTNDDLSLQNELASMSADQRMTQAMNMLLYGSYVGQNTKGTANSNMLYGFLESQLNSWAAKTIKGVDLSFGIDQYNDGKGENSGTQTSYSYEVSKSLFNNRFKIQVGGNYNTDSSGDDIANNFFSNISAEYILKQTQTMNMSVKLFRHIDFESILEGDITETGAGFVFKRKFNNAFRFKKDKTPAAPGAQDVNAVVDSLKNRVEAVKKDSIAIKKEEGNE
ncbi:MAG: translocation/assembly module TamB, partial [Muribaculaceae bacterium]|nr:translocation/assembly module TamB [Muribaculaceae bacterium]